MSDLNDILKAAFIDIEAADSLDKLDKIRVTLLGKKGLITQQLKTLGTILPEERPLFGQKINQAKESILNKIDIKKINIENKNIEQNIKNESIDVTLPGFGSKFGSLHPVSKTLNRLENIFKEIGFDILQGPEIEDDFHNFAALNIPEYHPARAMHDTFYFADGNVLRTHTSPVQIRAMQNAKPPFRCIAAGRVYRCDSDLTHTPMFHQLEGFMVDENISFAHLKGILNNFLQTFFEKNLKTRFRPSYFPFTEPSAEVDMECANCDGVGCRVCKNTGWLEILGCGMVHPKVLQSCNIDSEKYTGWAFGIGVDRLAMLRYKIDDLRLMFENDKRFLEQF